MNAPKAASIICGRPGPVLATYPWANGGYRVLRLFGALLGAWSIGTHRVHRFGLLSLVRHPADSCRTDHRHRTGSGFVDGHPGLAALAGAVIATIGLLLATPLLQLENMSRQERQIFASQRVGIPTTAAWSGNRATRRPASVLGRGHRPCHHRGCGHRGPSTRHRHPFHHVGAAAARPCSAIAAARAAEFYDEHHLTLTGSRRLQPTLEQLVSDLTDDDDPMQAAARVPTRRPPIQIVSS